MVDYHCHSSVRVADLVIYTCPSLCKKDWGCFFCSQESTCIGIVVNTWVDLDDQLAVTIEFDVGQWSLRGNELRDLEVLSTIPN